MKYDLLRSKICAWLVTDSKGNSALLRDRARAESYSTHVIDGRVDGLVKISDVIEEMIKAEPKEA